MPTVEEAILQRNVFPWIELDEPFKEKSAKGGVAPSKLISAHEVVKKHGVPRHELQQYIETELEQTEAFASLPFTLFFVVAYALVAIVHDDAEVIRAVQHSISFDIVDNANYAFDGDGEMGFKDMEGVHGLGDFWSWMMNGFIPLMWDQGAGTTEGRNESDPRIAEILEVPEDVEARGVYLSYNRIIGGLRMSQERGEDTDCPIPPGIKQTFYTRACVGKTKYETFPEQFDMRFSTDPQRTVWFYMREDADTISVRAYNMSMTWWVDEYTNKIEIAVPVYTSEYGLHSLTYVNFFFGRGGQVWKHIISMSTFAAFWTYTIYMVFDLVWILCLLHIFRTELKEIRSLVRNKGYYAIVSEYISIWNAIDWMSVIVGAIIVFLFGISFTHTSALNRSVWEISAVGDAVEHPDEYKAAVTTYLNQLENAVQYGLFLRLVLASYPLIVVTRLFKAFSAQPRLALVTSTLSVTGVDLLHFMLVFISIFVTLAIMGLVLFGRRDEEFTTFVRSTNTLFRLMLGDFDWDAMSENSKMEGFVYLVFTLVTLNLLLLNMVLAIVMDGYSEVKQHSAGADTLYTEIKQNVSRWMGVHWRKDLVALKDVDLALISIKKEYDKKKKEGKRVVYDESHPQGPILVGRDTKSSVNMRVQPLDEDIYHFLGEGHIEMMGSTGLEVRVKHPNVSSGQKLHEYKTGRDLTYELKLCDPKDIIEPEDDEDDNQSLQVLSPERLRKELQKRGHRMREEQAMELLTDAVQHYYGEHAEEVDIDGIQYVVRKVKNKVKKIEQVIADGGGQTLSSTAPEDMEAQMLMLRKVYQGVDEDRQHTKDEIRRLSDQVTIMWEDLAAHPEEKELVLADYNRRAARAENADEWSKIMNILYPPPEGDAATASAAVAEAGLGRFFHHQGFGKKAGQIATVEGEIDKYPVNPKLLSDLGSELDEGVALEDDDAFLEEIDNLLSKSAEIRGGNPMKIEDDDLDYLSGDQRRFGPPGSDVSGSTVGAAQLRGPGRLGPPRSDYSDSDTGGVGGALFGPKSGRQPFMPNRRVAHAPPSSGGSDVSGLGHPRAGTVSHRQ